MSALRARIGKAIPESLLLRFRPQALGYTREDIPGPITIPSAPVRMLVAPANEAEQGYAWARAVSELPGAAARNLEVRRSDQFSDDADRVVPAVVFARSKRWARGHCRAVAGSVSHVLIEAERGILGVTFDQDVRKEADWLDRHGISRAYVSHGSDLRLPSRHAELEEWSPFRGGRFEHTSAFEARAAGNARFLQEQNRPVFVSTPDLLRDFPPATWLPVVIDPARWATTEPVLRGGPPVVAHAPTSRGLKGTDLVEPMLQRLDADGVIIYRPISGLTHAEMPAEFARADIVLDSFGLGLYAAISVEAMAARRLVVSHVADDVRRIATTAGGMELPIVEADPRSLEAVLRDIANDPDAYRPIAESGPEFVGRLHDGRFSARALAPFLGLDGAFA